MKIGVFDSGIGGLSVYNAVKQAYPNHEVIFKNDSGHVPYGTRNPHEILAFVVPIIQKMVDEDCQVIVIACNTVSTTLMPELKAKFSVPFVALVPMIKPAAEITRNGVIAVCATPTTLASPRYKELKHNFAQSITVLEPDCSDWASMIERNEVDEQKIAGRIQDVLNKRADVIVLGCTHYHWVEDTIKKLAGNSAKVIQPEQAIVKQLTTVIEGIERQL